MIGSPKGDGFSHAVEKIDAAVLAGRLSNGAGKNLKQWLSEPEYAEYFPRLFELIEGDRFTELERLFWNVIPFGTGGRRGPMGELGSATINRRTIAESAHGLAVYLKKQKGEPGGRALVAHDTRNRSAEFARLMASTLAANALQVFFFESHRATPELSFAVRHLNCDVGVMISASHNPPSDNGCKAYWSTGGQVLPPHDQGIIDCVYQAVGKIPTLDFDQAVAAGRIVSIGETVDRAYVAAVLRLSLSTARELPVIFSPLHGVGETSVYRVLLEAGFTGVELFEPHRNPDGNFTNVPNQLPNPEHSEVYEPLIVRARQTGAELILASDPDADRLGVAARNAAGDFVHLDGNRIGALLTDYILRKQSDAGRLSAGSYVVETLVTTPLISAIACSHGVRVIDDLLVGFKYIAETMDREGPDEFVFGAEESLGYLAGSYCRDKDAAIAALYITELAAELRSENKTLLERLDELYAEHGCFVEGQRFEVCEGAKGKEQIEMLMRTFRESPPLQLGDLPLAWVRDYSRHELRALPKNTKVDDLPKPDGNLLFFQSVDADCRLSLAVRPSGTEPKIKFYFFAWAACDDPVSLADAKDHADRMLTSAQNALSKWVRDVLVG